MNYRRLLTTMIMASLLFLGLLTRFVGVAEAAGASEEATNRLHALRESATPERRSQTGLEREPALSLPPAIPPPRPLLNGTSILTITTTADPTSVDEPGGVISYTVSVTNITDTIDITITALTDNSGDLNGKGDCSTSSLVLNPSQNYTCSYTATVSGNGGQSITNTITATAQYSGTTQAQASDDATVTINDITPSITVQLDNDASGDDIFTDNEEGTPNTSVTFQLVITNNTNEDVTIDTISDDHSSPMTSSKSPSCASISTNLAANSSVTCYYDGIIPNDDNLNEVYTVTVDVLDDETNPGSDDDTSTVTTPDELPNIDVNAGVNPISILEPGDIVNFSIGIDNDNSTDVVTITNFSDSFGTDVINSGNCSVPRSINPGLSYSCSYSTTVSGNAGQKLNLVSVSGIDDDGSPVNGSDLTLVEIQDKSPSINVTLTPNPTSVPEPGGSVDFTVRVDNNSSATDPVTIDSIDDSVYGNLVSSGDCSLPPPIPAGSFYECTYSKVVSGNPGDSQTNQVTVNVTDDDVAGLQDDDNDSVTVDIDNVPSSISVTVTPNPSFIPEPGGTIAFTVRVDNTSPVDSVDIDTLQDSVYGNLNGQGNCSTGGTIPAGNFYECTFNGAVNGSPGDTPTNMVTVDVTDDDGFNLQDDDDATVNIIEKPTFTVYLPIILKPAPTDLSVWNDNTGGNVIFTVLGTGVSCTVPNNTTQFCGSFPAGTYTVQVSSACGNGTFPKAYASGPQTTRVFCN